MSQERIIYYLKNVGPASANELADYLGTTYGTVNVYLFKLHKKQIVERTLGHDSMSSKLVYIYKLRKDGKNES